MTTCMMSSLNALAYALKTPYAVFLPVTFPSFFIGTSMGAQKRSQWNVLATLTYELDLYILPLDLHAKMQVRTSVYSAARGNTQTDTQTMSKLLHLSRQRRGL